MKLLMAHVLGTGEERDRVVAAGAIAGFGGASFIREDLLHSLERWVHGREPVGAGLPLGKDLLVAAAARHVSAQELGPPTCESPLPELRRRRVSRAVARGRVVSRGV